MFTNVYNNKKVELIKLELREDDNRFFLHAAYQIEHNDGSIEEYDIPNIKVPLSKGDFPSVEIEHGTMCHSQNDICRIGTDDSLLRVFPDKNGQVMKSKRIKEPDPKEMTMEEIEKKLGYPIKIVKEKRNEQEKEKK